MDISTDGLALELLSILFVHRPSVFVSCENQKKNGRKIENFVHTANQIGSNQSIVHSAGFLRLK